METNKGSAAETLTAQEIDVEKFLCDLGRDFSEFSAYNPRTCKDYYFTFGQMVAFGEQCVQKANALSRHNTQALEAKLAEQDEENAAIFSDKMREIKELTAKLSEQEKATEWESNRANVNAEAAGKNLQALRIAERELASLREAERRMRTCLENIKELGRVTMADENGREIILAAIGEALSAAPERGKE